MRVTNFNRSLQPYYKKTEAKAASTRDGIYARTSPCNPVAPLGFADVAPVELVFPVVPVLPLGVLSTGIGPKVIFNAGTGKPISWHPPA